MNLKELAAKEQILKEAGYKYFFERALYLNRDEKKAFSIEFVEEKPVEELKRKIAEDTAGSGWHFFFNGEEPPSDSVQKELSRVLG